MERASRDGLPLKVQPLNVSCFEKTASALNPELPAKKRLPRLDGDTPVEQNIRRVKPGVPVKKRVNAWLLEEPFPRLAEESHAIHPVVPR
jgi:hypothetical protein